MRGSCNSFELNDVTTLSRTLGLSATSLLVLIAGCGGGGSGGSAAPEAASPPPTVSAGTQTPDTPTGGTTPTDPVVTPDPNPGTTDPGTQQPQPDPKPVAVVPAQVDALVKRSVSLDASKSTGVSNSAVTYLWSLESKPATSNAQLNAFAYPILNFYPDVVGTYQLKLVVSSGGKSSDPVTVTVGAIEPGSLTPLATFKASGFQTYDSVQVSGCSFYRDAANYSAFWDFRSDLFAQWNCPFVSGSIPADLQAQGSFGGGQLSYLAANLINLQGSGISGKSLPVWADVNTLSGYGYSVSAESIELNKVPLGKATGTVFMHSTVPAYLQPWTTGSMQYKVEADLERVNVPAGWEVSQDISVRVMLEGSTFENNTPGYASSLLFERTYTADFSETIPLNLNWAQQPIALAGNVATIRSTVVHRMTFKRISE